MNCETPDLSSAPAVGPTATQFGNLLPATSALTEESLEGLLTMLLDSAKMACRTNFAVPVAPYRPPRHCFIRGWVGYVSATLVEDGWCPIASTRGESFYGDYYLVDRRRARRTKRIIAQHNRKRTNATIRHHSSGR